VKIIPAIDLKNGRCVRLIQGKEDQETVYGEDPVEIALSFEEQGAEQIHLVDLDGAFRGESKNLEQVKRIAQAVKVPLELGGGIRSLDDISRVFDLGVSFVIIGTIAVKNPKILEEAIERFGNQLILGLDAKDGKVAVSGWVEITEFSDEEFAIQWKQFGIDRVIYTDIARDGMLTGPNLSSLRRMAISTGLKVTASGGVSSLDDLKQLAELERDGVDEVIVGKAIYERQLDLREACLWLKQHAALTA
jgi:phosphoribosylformimino-5-aminoimidazole carboxamide ribotide isomerase